MQQITCLPFDWFEKDDKENNTVSVNAWCLNGNSGSCLVRFVGFQPKVTIQLPILVNNRPFRWTRQATNLIYRHLQNKMEEHAPTDCIPMTSKSLYYFNGGKKKPIMKMFFPTKKAIYECRKLLKYPLYVKGLGSIELKLWGQDIDSIRQFLTVAQCKYSQWFNANAMDVPENKRISTLKKEYIVKYTDITPIAESNSKHLRASPKILSYDIEAYSDIKGTFPVSSFAKHVAYMISCTFQRLGDRSTRKRFLILMGDCEDLPNAEVIRVSDEAELCLAFTNLIKDQDPDIIMGYNTHAFDDFYLNARLERLDKEWDIGGSRLKDTKPVFKSRGWSSKQSRNNILDYIEFPGRINIDMYTVIRKEHTLPKFTLNYVSKVFLKDEKYDVPYEKMFEIYKLQSTAINALTKCTSKWIKKGKDEVLDNEMYVSACNDLKPKYHENVSKDVIKNVVKRYEHAKELMTDVSDYCVQDAELVIDLFEHLNVWIGLIELSNCVEVRIFDVYTRGQQWRGKSKLYNLLEQHNAFMDGIDIEDDDSKFQGAYVGNPIPGKYDRVATSDFSSLYPSIIKDQNICYSTYVPESVELTEEEEKKLCNKPIIITEEVEDDEGNKITVTRKHRFVKKEIHEGYVPIMVGQLIDDRKKVKEQIKALDANDHANKLILDKRQWALKIAANSIYGILGIKKGRLPFRQGAESVTFIGRGLILRCNKHLEEKHGAKVIYGDTDSVMFVLQNADEMTMEEYIEKCREINDELTNLFGHDLRLELEKIALTLFIAPKKYAMWKYVIDKKMKIKDENGENIWVDNPNYGKLYDKEHEDAYLLKGIILARRDNCEWQRRIYTNVLHNIMEGVDYQDTMDTVIEECINFMKGEVGISDLIIIKGLGSHYKNEEYHMKVFADHLKSIGKPAVAGSRLEYVIVNARDGADKLGGKMRLPEIYHDRMKTDNPEPIDYLYYIGHMLTNCVEQLIQVGYQDIINGRTIKIEIERNTQVINDLVSRGFRDILIPCWNYANGDVIKTVEFMCSNESPIKNKAIESRRKFDGFHDLFHHRMYKKPITQFSRCYTRDMLKEYVKYRGSEKLYNKLYSKP